MLEVADDDQQWRGVKGEGEDVRGGRMEEWGGIPTRKRGGHGEAVDVFEGNAAAKLPSSAKPVFRDDDRVFIYLLPFLLIPPCNSQWYHFALVLAEVLAARDR